MLERPGAGPRSRSGRSRSMKSTTSGSNANTNTASGSNANPLSGGVKRINQAGREKDNKDPENASPLPKWFIHNTKGWRRAVQHFTPSWFAATMGTGIVSIVLNQFSIFYTSYEHSLRIMSIVFFILNLVLFVAISFVALLRYTLYPGTWILMLRHPVQSLFLGCIPMGFSTLINMFVLVCVPAWGGATIRVAWALWWIDVVASMACCLALPFQMMTKHEHSHETMTAAWLLPIVATIVASASGSVVATELTNPQEALWTILTSYISWGAGIPLALGVMVMYFHRLAVHSLPPSEVIVSVFLPLGPLGQGGFAIMKLGNVAMKVFPQTRTLHVMAGDVLYVLGFGVAIVLWGFGLVWLFFAVASIWRSRIPFNMGWWGFVFPTGTFTLSTLTMGGELPSAFFRILGTVFGVCVMVLWLVVAGMTLIEVITGTIYKEPELEELEKRNMRQDSPHDSNEENDEEDNDRDVIPDP